MLKLFLSLAVRLPKLEVEASPENAHEEWRRDPLLHPSLAAMSMRELADLPMRGFRDLPEPPQGRPWPGLRLAYSAASRLGRKPPDCRFHSLA